mmetsp:Transcript_36307/g.58272  ORF Transcript_36307/g.58272 Transcript_36307/m.58272 type:complete len:522 (+) Transcript_36307:50-1615(+)
MSAHISGGYAVEPPTYGKVLLHTTVGDIDIELWPKQAPKACRNFVQLAMEEYYNGCIFHRVIPNFMVQTGDPSNTGNGGESIYGIPFKDEFHSRLKFSHRGIVAMANSGQKNENQSQFFITLDKASWLDRKHTIFGKVTGNTLYNLLKFNDLQIENDKTVIPQKITSIEILLSPFDDIQPRLTRTQKREIEQEEKKQEKLNKQNQLKQLGAKNDAKLLAFGEDEESEEDQEDDDDEFSKQERKQLRETENKLKAMKERRKQIEMAEEKQSDSKSSTNAAAATSKKRAFSEMNEAENDSDDQDASLKKAKTNQEIQSEYELLKKKLLETQQQNQADYGGEDDDDNEEERVEEEAMHGAAKLMQQREEYVKKTRMNKVQRTKYTMGKLNEFMEIMDKQSAHEEVTEAAENTKRKGKLDESTGIEFASDSEQEDDDYDPNWFQSKLEFQKRPQDADIYSVDDYETIYGNGTQDIESKRDKRNEKQHSYRDSDERKKRNRNRNGDRERNRDRDRGRYRNRNEYRR